jgi:Myb/SANT-like DNA-binding domain
MDAIIFESASTTEFRPARRSRGPRIEWDDKMHGAMLEGLVEAKAKGLQTHGGFKREGWMYGVRGAQKHTSQSVTREKINNKFDSDKKVWKEWLGHLDQSGWGWNEAKGVPEHTTEFMDAYFAQYPKRRPFRESPPKFKEFFEALVDGGLATGRAARTTSTRVESSESHLSDEGGESDAIEQLGWETIPPPEEAAQTSTSRTSSNPQVSPGSSPLGGIRKRGHPGSSELGQLELLAQAIITSASQIERAQKNRPVPLQMQAMQEVWNLGWLTEEGRFALHRYLEDSTKALAFMSLPIDRRQRWVRQEIGSNFVVVEGE